MKPSSEKAKSASKVSSRGSLEGRVPRLRFPGFEGEWETARIGELYSERSQRCTKPMELLSVTISDGVVPRSNIESKDNSSEDKSNYKVVHVGDMVYNTMRMWQGACGVSSFRGIVSPAYTILKEVMRFDRKFMASLFKTKRLINDFRKNSQGLTSDTWNLKYPQIAIIKVSLPDIEEQQQIATFLSLLDSRIAAQRKLVELLKKQKRGLSNALFSGKLRMVNDLKWKVYRLGDIVRRVTRKNGSASDVPLTISAQHGLIDQREFFSKSVASADMSGYYLLKQGEFAYNRSSSGDCPFGSIKRLERYAQGAVSTLYICFEAIGDSDDSEFLKWYFDSFAWHREVGMICAEGARNHGLLNVPTEGFFDTKHLLPSDKEERKKMAMFMALEAARCEHAEYELARLTELKAGFLQQMFA